VVEFFRDLWQNMVSKKKQDKTVRVVPRTRTSSSGGGSSTGTSERCVKQGPTCSGAIHNLGRNGRLTPYCNAHLAHAGFVVKDSAVSNKGLFTTRRWESGDVVVEYVGKVITEEERDEILTSTKKHDPRKDYISQLSEGKFVDAWDQSISSVARFANDARGSRYSTNVEQWHMKSSDTFTTFVACRAINGSMDNPVELFLDYGESYWK